MAFQAAGALAKMLASKALPANMFVPDTMDVPSARKYLGSKDRNGGKRIIIVAWTSLSPLITLDRDYGQNIDRIYILLQDPDEHTSRLRSIPLCIFHIPIPCRPGLYAH